MRSYAGKNCRSVAKNAWMNSTPVCVATSSLPLITGTTTLTNDVSVRLYRSASQATSVAALYSLATTRSRDWYQYRTSDLLSPLETRYRLISIGAARPGTVTGIVSDTVHTQPDPGRQFFGECGVCPA